MILRLSHLCFGFGVTTTRIASRAEMSSSKKRSSSGAPSLDNPQFIAWLMVRLAQMFHGALL